MTDDSQGTTDQEAPTGGSSTGGAVRARRLLGVRELWIFPLAVPAVMVALIATIYIGSVINPTGHLHGLPVLIVDEDAGATTAAGHVVLGPSVVHALTGSEGVSSRLDLRVVSLVQAEQVMDQGGAYATLVIPKTFTASALLDAGYTAAAGTPATATVQLLENQRLGSLGVNLAAGVLSPAMDKVSKQVGAKLTAESTSAVRSNPVLAAQLADPVVLKVQTYRPLPPNSALGLSAFYVAVDLDPLRLPGGDGDQLVHRRSPGLRHQ